MGEFMDISLRQIRAFREVMRLGSISEAARALGRTQPTVSTTIANLEQELGFVLFERQKSRMLPTPEAHYFLEESIFVLDRLNRFSRTMRQIGNMNKGTLKIACLPLASTFLLPREIVKFTKDRPEVSVSLMMRSSEIVQELVASQQVDIGFAENPEPRATLNIRSFEFDCVCALHIDDPLASRSVITPSDLDGRPLAALSREHPMNRAITKVFEESGSTMFHRFDFQTTLPALELVENNVCCAIFSSIAAASYQIYRHGNPKIVFRPFRPLITSSVSVLTPARRPQSLLAKAFNSQFVSTLETLVNSGPSSSL